jgi:nucleotide-binding universal stress UspA family protein
MAHIRKILVPVDGSPPSISALSQAANLAEDLGASVDVLHVHAPAGFEVGSTTGSAESEEEEHAFMDAVAEMKGRFGDRLTHRTVSGDPIHVILEAGAAADLIVMGTHGRVGRLHAIIGSVAESVVRNSPCPVLTVRVPDGEAESFKERVHGRPGIARRKPAPG